MTMISDLSGDLVEEILSRVSMTCGGRMRSTCKVWNVITNNQSFIKKHCVKAPEELRMIMLTDCGACLMSVNLRNPEHLVESSIKLTGKFGSQVEIADTVDISQVLHCNGLLLFVPSGNTRPLVVCNPYLGQVRLIQPKKNSNRLYVFAIGYDNSNNNYKILRLSESYRNYYNAFSRTVVYEIYNFETNSWKVVRDRLVYTVPSQGHIIEGRYLLCAQSPGEFLLCFDFTRERFGPPLQLPFHSCTKDSVILSTIREEQLVVLYQRDETDEINIWITTKIERDALSWRIFLKVNRTPSTVSFFSRAGTFLVDEKKKVAVICYRDGNWRAYMIGNDGYYKVTDLGKSAIWPNGCPYVPSTVQIQ